MAKIGAPVVVTDGPGSFEKKFRDPFLTWPNENWNTDRQASGDIIVTDGNAAGASYLSISLDPLSAGTETWIESSSTYGMPVELGAGIHMSQRTTGQEFSLEIVSNETPPTLPVSGVNYNRNGYAAGAVTGTPGTPPTNWTLSASGVPGLTSTITDLGVGVINGVNVKLTRLDVTGTATGSGSAILQPEIPNFIPAVTGQIWTASSYAYGTSTHQARYLLREADAAGTGLGQVIGASFDLPAVATRTSLTGTLTNASTARVLGRLEFPITNGDTVNISVVYALPQMELGSVASAPTATVGNSITAPTTDLVIASISQATSTLSITTAQAHKLHAGDRIGVYGVSDSRLNYPSLVVATTPTATTLTVTAAPFGQLPSVTAGPFANGLLYSRSAMGRAPNGTSMILENTTVTQGSFYAKSDAGDPTPIGGTITGNHSSTMSTTASIQAINAALNYAFEPTTEFRLSMFADRVQWSDATAADNTVSQSNNRASIVQVIPNPDKRYKIRVRATNNEGLTVPVAHIQSVAKAGSTVATITTQTPHGLTTGDLIAAYGVRDFTNFPNLTAATAVASVIDANNFTVAVWGTSSTTTSQSGVIYRVNGGILPSALGAIAQVVQSVTRTSNILTVVGSAAWAGFLIGDYVNLAALHDTSGVDLLLDGAYRVRDIQTTSLFLEPLVNSEGVYYAPIGTDIVSTNCGGAVIKRTDMRISFLRLFDFERLRVEMLARPATDLANAVPVVVQGNIGISAGALSTVSTVTTVGTAGTPPVPATPYFLNSAASTNGALIITGTSAAYSIYATNIGATAAFVKLYNKATAPTVGTDVPEMIIPVPAAVSGFPGVANVPAGYIGNRFALGLGIAITGAVADSDTTAVAAGQVKVKLARTV